MEAGDIGLAVMFLIWVGFFTMPCWSDGLRRHMKNRHRSNEND